MGLLEELQQNVRKTFTEKWTPRDGQKVPLPEELSLSNECVKIEGTVLYADLAESTKLVESKSSEFAAEVYKTYLYCASKIIKNFEGEITAFDGDRAMAVYFGESKNTNAVQSALAINYAVDQIINPILLEVYKGSTYILNHGVGIDTGSLLVARTGVRGSNDLVWVGNAANYAAKLSAMRDGNYTIWITENVFNRARDVAKKSKNNVDMWTKTVWPEKGTVIYKSSWWRSI